jgi:hypothetical protein
MIYVTVRLKNFWFLLRALEFKEIVRKILVRVFSEFRSIGLMRDLTIPLKLPIANIPLMIRPLEEEDIPKIFDFKTPGLTEKDKSDLLNRLEHVHAHIPTCYVAVTPNGVPVFIGWLMAHTENEKIQAYFNGIFPLLTPDAALLENVLTLVGFRRQGVMKAAVALIAERGTDIGAKRVIVFVEEHNIASLRGMKQVGFSPYVLRHEKWFLFHRTLTFTKLPENTPYTTLD